MTRREQTNCDSRINCGLKRNVVALEIYTCGTWVVAFRVRWHLPVEFRENSTRFRGPDGLKIALFWPYAITVQLTDRSVFSARSFVPVYLLLMGDHEICINCPIHGIIIEWIYSTTTRLTLAIKPPPIKQTHHECDYPIDPMMRAACTFLHLVPVQAHYLPTWLFIRCRASIARQQTYSHRPPPPLHS